jgi:hypothetical protein
VNVVPAGGTMCRLDARWMEAFAQSLEGQGEVRIVLPGARDGAPQCSIRPWSIARIHAGCVGNEGELSQLTDAASKATVHRLLDYVGGLSLPKGPSSIPN